MNLARLFLRGSALSVADQLLRALSALLLTPLMVAQLGSEDFGLWVLLTGFFSQYILLDIGLNASLPHFLGLALGSGSEDRWREVASTAWVMLIWIALAGATATIATWLLLPWFIHSAPPLATARTVVLMLGLSMAVHTLTRVFVHDLISHLRNDIVSAVGMTRVVVCSALAWWALKSNAGLRGLALVHGSGTIVEALVLVIWNRALLSRIRFRWASKDTRRAILQYSRWSYALTTSERLRGALDPFLLGGLLGSAASGVYSLGMKPVGMVYDFAYSFIGGQLLPVFSRLHAEGNTRTLEQRFLLASRVSALIAAFGAAWLLGVGPVFLHCWVPAQAKAALPVLWCLAGPFSLYAAQIPSIHLLYSLSQHRALALIFMVGVIVNLALSAIFTLMFGIVGAALGTAVEMTVVYGLVLPWLMAAKMDWPLGKVFARVVFFPLLRGLAIASPAAAAWWLIPAWPIVVMMTAGLGVWFVTAIAGGLAGKEERVWFWRMLGKAPTGSVRT